MLQGPWVFTAMRGRDWFALRTEQIAIKEVFPIVLAMELWDSILSHTVEQKKSYS